MREKRWIRSAGAILLGAALAGLAALASADPPTEPGRAPDPPALASKKQWVFDVRYHGGAASIDKVSTVTFDKPASTARMMGRFAIELYIGPELLDRARFNVPLTADPRDPTDHRPNARPTFGDVNTHVSITMADNPRATYVVVVDRANGAERKYWWPPEIDGRLVPFATSDAGTDAPAPKPPVDAGGG